MYRLLILLVLLITSAHVSDQPAVAQTACPQDGCRVFLPFVPRTVLATATVEGHAVSRYCYVTYFWVRVTNISDLPLTAIEVRGQVNADFGVSARLSLTIDDVLFPGETNRYVTGIDECIHDYNVAEVNVVAAKQVVEYQKIDVVSSELVLVDDCDGYAGEYTYEISGIIRNAGMMSLQNVNVFVQYGSSYEAFSEYIDVERSTLGPGESTRFSGRIHFYSGPIAQCSPGPVVIPPDHYVIRAWGIVMP